MAAHDAVERVPTIAWNDCPSSVECAAWLQHILHQLSPTGTAGVVLANGSMSSTQSGEGEMRRAMIEGVKGEAGVVDCMIALPGQLFYSTQIPACLWFLAKDKSNGVARDRKLRDRRGEVLFIDARKLGFMVDRTRKEFADADIARIADTYHAWRLGEGYEDIAGFCKSAMLEEIRSHGHVLTPGRYVGAEAAEEDETPFIERFAALQDKLEEQFAEADRLTATIRERLAAVMSR
jgi:type I restriction enzyme M protein